ncbi:MAG TPA: tryptophan synthase subunit alpha [Alphaproteobacteria bacterium]|nr:tryptophan synthase subunit alpha [Alphaproteobacteria bacterium]
MTVKSLRQTLLDARAEKRAAFIPFVMAGDPDMAASVEILLALQESGAAAIELGVPFSDPVADGETVQRAAERALAAGATLAGVFDMLTSARARGLSIPVCLFSYLNPVFYMGYAAFAAAARKAGAQGALIVDLPPEAADDYLAAMKAEGMETVFLCSPTTSPARLARIDAASSGFVYYVSREGVTGAQENLPASLGEKLAALRATLQSPLAVGFGISTPAHVKALEGAADAVVVGSALVKTIAAHGKEAASAIAKQVKDLRAA